MQQPLAFRSYQSFTQEQFASWLDSVPTDDLHHYELLDGFIVREPPAGWPHGEIEIEIGWRLSAWVKPRRLGRTFGSSQGFDLPTGDTVQPDLSFVSTARWQPNPGPGFLRVVPDLLFEILSPGTRDIDQRQKKRIYARNEVREYVLVDPRSQTLERFCLADGSLGEGRVFYANDYESHVLPGFVMPVGELFVDG